MFVGDILRAKNFSNGKKWYLTMLAGILVLNTTFASSAPAGAIEPISERFGLSEIVGTLMISLFVMGYVFGPLLWGPVCPSKPQSSCSLTCAVVAV